MSAYEARLAVFLAGLLAMLAVGFVA